MAAAAQATRQSTGRADGRADGTIAPGGRLTGWAGLLGTPVVLLVILGALYLYLSNTPLDNIEKRSINAATIGQLLLEHINLVIVSSIAVIVIAVPLGVLLTRPGFKRVSSPFMAVANLGQAVPSVGILVLLAVTVGTGFRYATIALVLAALLSVLANTMTGLNNVDPALIDAARGMGLTKWAVLFRVELPLAVPVVLAGIRVALILNVGNAALATYTNAGGLGTLIASGIALNRIPVLIAGSVLTAVLALAVDWLAGVFERIFRPRGL